MITGYRGRYSAFDKYRQQAVFDENLFSGPEYAIDPEAQKRIEWARKRKNTTDGELQARLAHANRMKRYSRGR